MCVCGSHVLLVAPALAVAISIIKKRNAIVTHNDKKRSTSFSIKVLAI